MPQLVPENRHTNQLVADEECLLDNDRAMLSHAVHYVQCGLLPHCARRLRSDSQRIDERLRVVLADFGEKVVDVPSDVVARRLNPRDDLH